jgi:predicted nucleotidyltransferase
MASWMTLAERKRVRVDQIRAGVARLREELTEYGRLHGGKFLLYGSAASGLIRYDSDVDIIVDFADIDVAAAVDFVEAACARLQLEADVQPKSWCKEAFLRKIEENALVIP